MILDPCTVQTKLSQLPLVQIVKFQCLSNRKFPEFFKTHPTQSTFWLREETKESACRLSTCVRESMRTFKASKPASHWASNWVRTTRSWQRTQIVPIVMSKSWALNRSSAASFLVFSSSLSLSTFSLSSLIWSLGIMSTWALDLNQSEVSILVTWSVWTNHITGQYYLDSSPSFFNTWVANTGWVFLLVNGSLTWTLH